MYQINQKQKEKLHFFNQLELLKGLSTMRRKLFIVNWRDVKYPYDVFITYCWFHETSISYNLQVWEHNQLSWHRMYLIHNNATANYILNVNTLLNVYIFVMSPFKYEINNFEELQIWSHWVFQRATIKLGIIIRCRSARYIYTVAISTGSR